MSAELRIPVPCGELVDKITILEIKQARIADGTRRRNVETELRALRAVWQDAFGDGFGPVTDLAARLASVNAKLWDIEDDIRQLERAEDFGPAFVALARAVYLTNDERADIKRRINLRLHSALVEEKSYVDYAKP